MSAEGYIRVVGADSWVALSALLFSIFALGMAIGVSLGRRR